MLAPFRSHRQVQPPFCVAGREPLIKPVVKDPSVQILWVFVTAAVGSGMRRCFKTTRPQAGTRYCISTGKPWCSSQLYWGQELTSVFFHPLILLLSPSSLLHPPASYQVLSPIFSQILMTFGQSLWSWEPRSSHLLGPLMIWKECHN